MKKKQLKEELEVAKATLELAMAALRLLTKKKKVEFPSGGYDPLSNLDQEKIKAFKAINKFNVDNPLPIYLFDAQMYESGAIYSRDELGRSQLVCMNGKNNTQSDIQDKNAQAGDKIVEDDNSNWFTKNDDGTYTIKLTPSTNITCASSKQTNCTNKIQKESEYPDYVCIKEMDNLDIHIGEIVKYENGQYINISRPSLQRYRKEFFGKNKDHFKVCNPKKETPLSDLNAEVQREHEEQEKYTKLANELVEMFMPLVNGWRKMDKATCATQAVCDNAYWFYNSGDQRKQAIRCAIKHSELNNYFDSPKVISQLQKMLSE